jgi:hypothetical protein
MVTKFFRYSESCYADQFLIEVVLTLFSSFLQASGIKIIYIFVL